MSFRIPFLTLILNLISCLLFAQNESLDYPFKNESEFFSSLPVSIPNSDLIKQSYATDDKQKAISLLANYFKEKAKERFFFNWNNLPSRLDEYLRLYPSASSSHGKSALDHTSSYHADTPWKLPFENAKGETMNAYAVRHLYRQHKAGDLAFSYYLSDQSHYLTYFTAHIRSLNKAFSEGKIEFISDGNGGYESFRAGNRVENWLLAHHLFLASPDYKEEDQLMFIRTMLHHAEILYHTNQKFQYGNHQTKGMVALAAIAMLYPEFDLERKFFNHSTKILGQHLDLEVNKDGFQFERSFHYHVGDIDNYFRVLKLAQITGNILSDEWVNKLKDMFTAMKAIALPNKKAPVIQDDTDFPMSSFNELASSMALGYVLFEDPEFGYLASSYPSDEYYWLLSQNDLLRLKQKREEKISLKSTALTATGYYVFREGWNQDDHYMLISAGLSKEKPDHQHGDMLGFQLYANGKMLMPNYQVRYPYPEFSFFKNSWVKNVAMVDSIPHGQKWTGNQGGSGFGKFQKLPKPHVLVWEPEGKVQVFRGTHDGYKDLQVSYERSIYFFTGEFFLVRDRFISQDEHVFYQNFQGNYSTEAAPFLVQSNQDDGSGLDLLQLGSSISSVHLGGTNGKNRVTYQSSPSKGHEYVSIIRPYKNYQDRIHEESSKTEMNLGEWTVFKQKASLENLDFHSDYILVNKQQILLLGMNKVELADEVFTSATPVDLLLTLTGSELTIKSLEGKKIELKGTQKSLLINSLQTISIQAK